MVMAWRRRRSPAGVSTRMFHEPWSNFRSCCCGTTTSTLTGLFHDPEAADATPMPARRACRPGSEGPGLPCPAGLKHLPSVGPPPTPPAMRTPAGKVRHAGSGTLAEEWR